MKRSLKEYDGMGRETPRTSKHTITISDQFLSDLVLYNGISHGLSSRNKFLKENQERKE